jgi:hypothetical protein
MSADLRDVAWRFLIAMGAGSLIGAVIGGGGGRLAMLLLRLGSSASVRGVTTDDGFAIGRFTTATGFLMMVTAGLGGATGVAYIVVRSGLPARPRTVIWGAFLALLVGADLLKPTSLDFTILDPKPFAIASFVVLPGLAAFAIAVAIERLLARPSWSSRPLTLVLAVGSLPLVPVLPAIAVVGAAVLAARRTIGRHDATRRLGAIVVPVVVTLLAIRSGVEIWRDTDAILSP